MCLGRADLYDCQSMGMLGQVWVLPRSSSVQPVFEARRVAGRSVHPGWRGGRREGRRTAAIARLTPAWQI